VLHVFFDLDGTLTDSADGITRCIAHALAELGVPSPPLHELTAFIGTPLEEVFGELLGTRDDRAIARACACYVERFYDAGIRENTLYPGVRDGLRRLGELDVALYVATAKTPRAAHEVVDLFELGPFFSGVHGVDPARVANKAALLSGIAGRELSGEAAMMVGDRHYDMAAGRSAGMSTVWAGWGYGAEGERERARPDHSVADFGALTKLIETVAVADCA